MRHLRCHRISRAWEFLLGPLPPNADSLGRCNRPATGAPREDQEKRGHHDAP